jgi:hypothetical protein
MDSTLETLFGQGEMALGRGGDVDNVHRRRLQHFPQVGKTSGDSEAFTELFGHEEFTIADGNNAAIRDPMDGLDMLIGNFTTTNDGNF